MRPICFIDQQTTKPQAIAFGSHITLLQSSAANKQGTKHVAFAFSGSFMTLQHAASDFTALEQQDTLTCIWG